MFCLMLVTISVIFIIIYFPHCFLDKLFYKSMECTYNFWVMSSVSLVCQKHLGWHSSPILEKWTNLSPPMCITTLGRPWPPAFLHGSPAGQLHPRNLTPLLLSLMHDSHSLKLDVLLSELEAGKKMNLIWVFPPQGAIHDMSPGSNYFTCMYVSKDLHASGTSVPYTLGFSVLFQVQVNPHEKNNKSTLHISL